MIFRTLPLAGFLLLAANLAFGQPAAKEAAEEKRPYTDKQTGITFPVEIGTLKLDAVKDFGDPKLGIGVKYKLDKALTLDVIIYNLGIEKISTDLEGADLKTQVSHAVENIKTYAERGLYRDLQLHEAKIVPLTEAKGAGAKDAPKAHLVVCAFTLLDVPRESRLYLFAYKNHFVKIRATWDLAQREAGEKALNGLLTWLADKVGEQ